MPSRNLGMKNILCTQGAEMETFYFLELDKYFSFEKNIIEDIYLPSFENYNYEGF